MLRLSHARRALPVALLLLVAAPAAHAAKGSANLLANPGFETPIAGHPWMPTAWDTSQAGLETVFFGRDTFDVHGGSYAVSVANVSTVWPFAHNWSQAIRVNKSAWGKDALLSVWTRNNGLQGRGYILLQAYRDTLTSTALQHQVRRDSAMRILNIKRIDDPAYDLGWKRQYFSEVESGWVQRQVRVFVPPLTSVLFVRCGLAGTGQVVFDDASLTLETALPPDPLPLNTNLLADPGFEEGGNAWEFSTPPYEGMHVDVDTTTSRTGRACGMMTGGNNGWVTTSAGFCQVLSNRDLGGKQVRMSGYLRTDSLIGVAYVRLYAHTLHGAVAMPGPARYSNTMPWTLNVINMDLPKDTYDVWCWFLYQAPAPGKVYYDDCSFEVIGPATGKYIPPPTEP